MSDSLRDSFARAYFKTPIAIIDRMLRTREEKKCDRNYEPVLYCPNDNDYAEKMDM